MSPIITFTTKWYIVHKKKKRHIILWLGHTIVTFRISYVLVVGCRRPEQSERIELQSANDFPTWESAWITWSESPFTTILHQKTYLSLSRNEKRHLLRWGRILPSGAHPRFISFSPLPLPLPPPCVRFPPSPFSRSFSFSLELLLSHQLHPLVLSPRLFRSCA